MLKLGLSPEDSNLRHLVNEDLYAKNTRDSPKMGDSKNVDPWFWTVGRPANMTKAQEAEWSVELDRVKWFCDRANRDRAVEQKETVEEEFGRAIEFFKKSAAVWKALKDESVARSGRAAYAHLKYDMYTKLAEDCATVQASAPGLSEKDAKQEEEEAQAELARKGLLKKPSDSWKAHPIQSFTSSASPKTLYPVRYPIATRTCVASQTYWLGTSVAAWR
ncbi:hypothetical protein FB451DRAFT_1508928 [Mycena latifolia]|nr:hypothetical protein FB451DRAFT_1508928 [Mycena latifolia]